MGENSAIEWTDATFNPFWGCAKVSPGCDNCYAEAWAKRTGFPGLWGVDADRRMFGDHHWNEPLKYERRALKEGRRLKVFCASMADVFDKNAPEGVRDRLWALIRATPHLEWLVLTKRIGNAKGMLPADWGPGYPNVWLGASIVNQDEADRDVMKLLSTPARIHFISAEPLLGPISFGINLGIPLADGTTWTGSKPRIDWIIVGGESGHHARPMDSRWAFEIISDCITAAVPVFFKQGSQANWKDFKNFDGFPLAFQIREWPEVTP